MKQIGKVDVRDASKELTTVGQELCSILQIHSKDKEPLEQLLGIDNIEDRKKFSHAQIIKIAQYLELPALITYIKNFQENYKTTFDRCRQMYKSTQKEFKVFKDVIKLLGQGFNTNIDRLNDVLDFFDRDSIDEILELNENNHALFKKNSSCEINQINLSAILRKGLIVAESNSLPEYNEQLLLEWITGRTWISEITNKQYLKSLSNEFNKFGVYLVFVPSLPKTVYGLVHWINERPLIIITDRDKDLATCWSTLFHELGHVINDRGCNIFEHEDCFPVKTKDLKSIEKKANEFVNTYLLNGVDLRKIVFAAKKNNDILKWEFLSKEYMIHELFIKLWLRKASIEPWRNMPISITFEDEV